MLDKSKDKAKKGGMLSAGKTAKGMPGSNGPMKGNITRKDSFKGRNTGAIKTGGRGR